MAEKLAVNKAGTMICTELSFPLQLRSFNVSPLYFVNTIIKHTSLVRLASLSAYGFNIWFSNRLLDQNVASLTDTPISVKSSFLCVFTVELNISFHGLSSWHWKLRIKIVCSSFSRWLISCLVGWPTNSSLVVWPAALSDCFMRRLPSHRYSSVCMFQW